MRTQDYNMPFQMILSIIKISLLDYSCEGTNLITKDCYDHNYDYNYSHSTQSHYGVYISIPNGTTRDYHIVYRIYKCQIWWETPRVYIINKHDNARSYKHRSEYI